ncbi:hypothetical protein FXN65_24160 [Metapseudomonas lalkuanensis]|uniref:Uncharacterized protein n=1 Tax=Metapseudomonas lalkuanensis TaxID=2604832 RepID=A0A5J6QR84_9GAMM|nr:hypothetical protein [Pseudomonas lalkuanensis]QEY65003.1 hypothetical protein FXN65_24160 [Pseudomonas lalkuanensis]
MESLFHGPYFDYVMDMEPLRSAEYFCKGSSAMLFKRDGRLWRLTKDCCGHSFLSQQSSKGNPNVVRIIHDFGPVAPCDDDVDEECYWLAEVERLEDIDPDSPTGQRLSKLLSSLTDDEPVERGQIPSFIEACRATRDANPDLAGLLETLIKAAEYVKHGNGDLDANLSNIMRRPGCGTLVWSDPLYGALAIMSSEEEARVAAIKQRLQTVQA